MQKWKPKNFKPEWPLPEDGCAFVLGGSLDGEIMQANPLPRYFKHAAPRALDWFRTETNDIATDSETYRLEEFRVGNNQRTIWLYIHESEPTDALLIRALTALCMFRRSAAEDVEVFSR